MLGKLSKAEKIHWEENAPHTAKYLFDKSKAKATINCSKTVQSAEDLFIYIENYPREPAVLSLIYEPDCMKYYFPMLQISEEELALAKKLVKSQVYAEVLAKVKDVSILDRLDASVNPRINITFNVLPKA